MSSQRNNNPEMILQGFQINWMKLRDANSGKILWECHEDVSSSDVELIARVPTKILSCDVVTREMNFSTVDALDRFRLEQTFLYKDTGIEEGNYLFGPVAANSNSTWHSYMTAAKETQMMPPKALSGNVVIETKFFDGDTLITTSRMRLFYI